LDEYFITVKEKKMKIEKSSSIVKRPAEAEGARDAEIR